jgi:hypothetical protein
MREPVRLAFFPMKLIRSLTAALAALVFSAIVFAAEASPAGAWKWTIETPNGEVEASATLQYAEGQLTGTYRSPFGEARISKGSFADGTIAFEVEREFDGNKFVLKFSGKLEGDAIKGTVQVPGFDGGEGTKQAWLAKRAG